MDKATADNDQLFMKMRKITASVLMSIDNALHDLVTTLDTAGMLSNTVLFVNSDNGGDTLYAKVYSMRLECGTTRKSGLESDGQHAGCQ
jgi:arylsulfatase A-like enzyme